MRRVLIVCPHFAPLTAADAHRARMSLPYFRDFGWDPFVLAVSPEDQPEAQEPALLATLPTDLPIEYVRAWPLEVTRRVGVGNVAIRAWRSLDQAGRRLIRTHAIDLVYFSTSMFMAMPLGRVWKRALSVPFVLDMQDPWVSEYQGHGDASGKRRLADALHARLEPWTMRKVDGIVAVSQGYIDTIRRRYPWIPADRCRMIPFGVSARDFDIAAQQAPAPSWFAADDGRVHVVSLGRGGADMAIAARILFRALRQAMPDAHGGCLAHFWFVGTDYSSAHRATIAPIAEDEGVGSFVTESPARIGLLDGLRLLVASDVLVLLGSDDPQYSPSKVYPNLAARRALVAVIHASSPVVPLLETATHGPVVTFRDSTDVDACAQRLAAPLAALLANRVAVPPTTEALLAPYDARELTRQQCALFDDIVHVTNRDATEAACRA